VGSLIGLSLHVRSLVEVLVRFWKNKNGVVSAEEQSTGKRERLKEKLLILISPSF
jgi:hypothetical protein